MAQQRQQRLEDRGPEGPSEADCNDDDYHEYEDWGAGGGLGGARRKAGRSSVAVTPGRKPNSRQHNSLASSQVQTAAQGRKKRGSCHA